MCFFGGGGSRPVLQQAAPAPAPTPQPSLVSPEDTTGGLRAQNTGRRSLRIDLNTGSGGVGANVPQ